MKNKLTALSGIMLTTTLLLTSYRVWKQKT